MTTVVPIVEGDGEVAAVPVLLRRLAAHFDVGQSVSIGNPIRVRRDRFVRRDEEFRRMVLLASDKCGAAGWVLILLDADDDCPVRMAAELAKRASDVVPDRAVSVVCANREFEAWYLACADSLDGKRGLLVAPDDVPRDPDAVRGAKEWLSKRIPGGKYRQTTDQPALAAVMDIESARDRSRSFRKFCDDWIRHARSFSDVADNS